MATKSEKKSSILARKGSVQPGPKSEKTSITRYEPTYRLESKRPLHRETCENIIKKVVTHAVANFNYSSKQAQIYSKNMSEEIKARVKLMDYDRYKLICIVTIGERYYQGYNSVCTALWDPEKDGFISHVHDAPNFYVVATLYYLYYN